jgi:hypothetical protein
MVASPVTEIWPQMVEAISERGSDRREQILPQGGRFLNLSFLPGPVTATLRLDAFSESRSGVMQGVTGSSLRPAEGTKKMGTTRSTSPPPCRMRGMRTKS